MLKRKSKTLALTPTDPRRRQNSTGRSAKAGGIRRRLKECKTPRALSKCLEESKEANLLDISVITSAVQKCGHCSWWDALLEVLELQDELEFETDTVYQSSCLRALECCLNPWWVDWSRRSHRMVQLARKQKALRIGKQVWQERVLVKREDFNCVLTSALKLCSTVGSPEAVDWGQLLWTWADTKHFDKDIVTYSAQAMLLEQSQQKTSVTALMQRMLAESLEPNNVFFGGLLEKAAERKDWKRADELWDQVRIYGIKPNILQSEAYAKAHFLSGRPAAALLIMDMTRVPVRSLPYKSLVNYLQALVIVSHASLGEPDLQRLSSCLDDGAAVIARNSPRTAKDQWRQLAAVAQNLVSEPQKLRLKDVLITHLAKYYSAMKDWENFKAGDTYLSAVAG